LGALDEGGPGFGLRACEALLRARQYLAARFLPWLKARGARVILAVPVPLMRLMSLSGLAGRHDCGAPRRPCSPYCAHHHGICYVAIGSRREKAVLGISESEYVARFTTAVHTDWVMRCTARKIPRTAEQEPVVLPPAKAQRAA
jgi:hypothetical protein